MTFSGRTALGWLILVVILGFVLLGGAAVVAYEVMLLLMIGGIFLADPWRWFFVALASVPIWMAYRWTLRAWKSRHEPANP
jgi:hypothetical protein